ncbi:MAG: single-stranded DNA-binding protein [Proteobacteria bacterium]|nr:single-stranded DNA-binding protein [Pseudomonadota bacterium]
MSIHVLLTGVLHKDAVARTSQNGNQYVTCTVRVEQDGQTVWANVICFDDLAQGELLRLNAGDAVSLQGKAMPKVYMKDEEARPSLQVTANAVLPLQPKYQPKPQATKNRSVAKDKPSTMDARREETSGADDGFDDPLPF